MKLKYKDILNTYSGLYKTALFYPEVLRLKREKLDFKRAQELLKNKIIELLRKGVKNREEIAKFLRMDKGVIYGHLHGWGRCYRTSTPGLIDSELVKVKKVGIINLYYI